MDLIADSGDEREYPAAEDQNQNRLESHIGNRIMKTALSICAGVACLAVAALCIQGIETLKAAEDAIRAAPALIDSAVSREGDKTREVLALAVNKLGVRAERQAVALRGDLRVSVGEVSALIDAQGFQMRRELRPTIKEYLQVGTEANRTIRSFRIVADQMSAGLPLYLDCTSGMCLANKLYGTAQAVERLSEEAALTARATREAFPPILANIDRTTATVDQRAKHSGLRLFFRGLK